MTTCLTISTLRAAKTTQEAALHAFDLGLVCVPVQSGTRTPRVRWGADYNPTREDLAKSFIGHSNLAVICGARSRGILDIDIDQDDAIEFCDIVFFDAPAYGRDSRPRSHRVLLCAEGITTALCAPAGAADDPRWRTAHGLTVVESQADKKLATFPPSVHPSGEQYRWDEGPSLLPSRPWLDVRKRLGAIAFMTLVGRHYPPAGSRHKGCLAAAGLLVKAGHSAATATALIRAAARANDDPDANNRGGAESAAKRLESGQPITGLSTFMEEARLEEYWRPTIRSWLFPEEATIMIDPQDPLRTAGQLVEARFTLAGERTIQRFQGDFYVFDGLCYVEQDMENIRAVIYHFLSSVFATGREGVKRFKPTAPQVGLVLDALKGLCAIGSQSMGTPFWLPGFAGPPPTDLISFENTMVQVPRLNELPLTPTLFNLTSLPVRFARQSPPSDQFDKFLSSMSEHDNALPALIEEVIGTIIAGETRFQKIFLIYGPTRSGKGLLMELVQSLLGRSNYASPLLSRLGDTHSMGDWIGKRAAFIQDARLGSRSDRGAITESLLTVSGGDAITVPRKYKSGWTGNLGLNIVMSTNEIPRLSDDSGALAGRFLPIVLDRSFYGREDHGLKGRLYEEREGILQRALQGLIRLRQRGHFDLPESSLHFQSQLNRSLSEIGSFLQDRFEQVPGEYVAVEVVHAEYMAWCAQQNIRWPSTREQLGTRLRSCGISRHQMRVGGRRVATYGPLRQLGSDDMPF